MAGTSTLSPPPSPSANPWRTETTASTAIPITTTSPTEVDYGPLSFNVVERSKSDFYLILATSSKLARQKLKEDRPADYSKLKYALTKGTYDKLTITKNLIEKEGKLNLE